MWLALLLLHPAGQPSSVLSYDGPSTLSLPCCPAPLPRSFYDKDAPIYTMSRFLPPSKVMGAGKLCRLLRVLHPRHQTGWGGPLHCSGLLLRSGQLASGRLLGWRSRVAAERPEPQPRGRLPPAQCSRPNSNWLLCPALLLPFSPSPEVERSILGDGCIVEPDARILHSVVGLRSIIREVSLSQQ